ncbi:MAG: carboxypeptidase-like regulatory domain-containing protein [Anditalea sp.]
MKKSLYQLLIRITKYSCVGIVGQLLLVGLCLAQDVDGQKAAINVSGAVTSSSDREGIPGVNILVKGTITGTVTDVEGNYAIAVPDETDTLVFSSIGYITQEEPVNGRSAINIVMEEDVQSLDEVVVVGYGEQKRVNLTGSVSTLSSEELTRVPVTNTTTALAGKLPGLIAVQPSGEPGRDNANLSIRGKPDCRGGWHCREGFCPSEPQ